MLIHWLVVITRWLSFKSVNVRLVFWFKHIESVRGEPIGHLYFLAAKAKTRSPFL